MINATTIFNANQYYKFAPIITQALSDLWPFVDLDDCKEWPELRKAIETEDREAVVECARTLLDRFTPTNPECHLCHEMIEEDAYHQAYPYSDGEGAYVICENCTSGLEVDEKGFYRSHGSTCPLCGKFHEEKDVFCQTCQVG